MSTFTERLLSMYRRFSIWRLYQNQPFLEAYAQHTNLRVEQDPKSAVGGRWEEIGKLQFDFLVRQGLDPGNTLLDIGCGTLRGGRHFIGYLKPGNYTGVDISSKAIAAAEKLVVERELSHKHPHLVVNERKHLDFDLFRDKTFDFLLAQSVFTHLPPDYIEECFQHLPRVMDSRSRFFFTFRKGVKQRQSGLKDFAYRRDFFEALAARNGFSLRDHSSGYDHPLKQQMLELRMCS